MAEEPTAAPEPEPELEDGEWVRAEVADSPTADPVEHLAEALARALRVSAPPAEVPLQDRAEPKARPGGRREPPAAPPAGEEGQPLPVPEWQPEEVAGWTRDARALRAHVAGRHAGQKLRGEIYRVPPTPKLPGAVRDEIPCYVVLRSVPQCDLVGWDSQWGRVAPLVCERGVPHYRAVFHRFPSVAEGCIYWAASGLDAEFARLPVAAPGGAAATRC